MQELSLTQIVYKICNVLRELKIFNNYIMLESTICFSDKQNVIDFLHEIKKDKDVLVEFVGDESANLYMVKVF